MTKLLVHVASKCIAYAARCLESTGAVHHAWEVSLESCVRQKTSEENASRGKQRVDNRQSVD